VEQLLVGWLVAWLFQLLPAGRRRNLGGRGKGGTEGLIGGTRRPSPTRRISLSVVGGGGISSSLFFSARLWRRCKPFRLVSIHEWMTAP
jgi:hypothetical protein